jgi:hypothetical protein
MLVNYVTVISLAVEELCIGSTCMNGIVQNTLLSVMEVGVYKEELLSPLPLNS